MKSIIQSRLSALRSEMRNLNIDAWYISGTDPHASEYIPEYWETRRFISGFTGSYGVVVVTHEKAALWTDSRYFIQAADELEGTGIEMIKIRVPDDVSPEMWLVQNLSEGCKVGLDAQTVSVAEFRSFQNTLQIHKLQLVETPDLFESIWENRPPVPNNEAFDFDAALAGLSRREKQQKVSAEVSKKETDYYVVSMLDELAWLYNLRGSDIAYNPVFMGFGLIGKDESYLFVDSVKIDSELQTMLKNDGVTLKNYDDFYSFLKGLKEKKIFIDTATANYSLFSALKDKNEIIEEKSIIAYLKSQKNAVELEGFRSAMKKDGVALVEFLFWLKETVGEEHVTDYEVGLKLAEFRAKKEGFKGESFAPIVGYNERGAIVHLHVTADNSLPLSANGTLLMDSGAQYIDGTTDITRTVALGKVSEQFKKDYTLVLKGMIALANAKFPQGTKGCNIDILARQAFWQEGLNYGHGTSHGVGHFLNVHEGPVSIRQEYNENPVMQGNVLSDEPGIYREGLYGIRIENLIVCEEKEQTEFGSFLGFETLTLCPIDTSVVDKSLLTDTEINWLNDYHKRVNAELKPLLDKKYHVFLDELTQMI